MSAVRPQIWLGDAVRALTVARDVKEQAQVLRLLGYDAPSAPPVTATAPAPQPSARPATTDRYREPDLHRATEPTPPPDEELPPEPPPAGEDRPEPPADLPLLQPARTEPIAAPAEPGEPLAPPGADPTRLPHHPLLTPHWTSAVLKAVLSRQVDEGPVDIAALIDALAHGRPVPRLPRRPVPTLRFGVQVLVDRGAGMQPFHRDQDELVARIRSVVGPEIVDVGYFSDVPQRGTGPGARWTRRPYQPPARDTRVLLVSDLGLGGPTGDPARSTREDWEDFVDRVSRAGCTAVALSPYPPHRWPRWMTRLLPLVSWDRTTNTGWIRTHMGVRTS
ncbi:hypothetical protein ACWCPI_16450 [Streptomyces sp. NPDC001920]